jgi:hypothetical protein
MKHTFIPDPLLIDKRKFIPHPIINPKQPTQR